MTYLLAKNTNFQVIYIEFRLIPEHKYPAALTDSYSTTKYLIANHKKYAIDLTNLILCGDSAGMKNFFFLIIILKFVPKNYFFSF